MSSKFALVIANTEYTDPGLAQLAAPGKDAEDFVRVLKDQNICAFDDIKVLLNQPEYIVRRGIDVFFDQKKPDDLLVLYFSGHGVRDELGTLYLAVRNTIRSGLRSTAVKSDYIREAMDQSRSKRQVLILDCCNSGAFAHGTKSSPGGSIGTASAFEGTGYGRVVLTASDSTQFAWEGDKVIGKTQNSLFTHFLIKGLEGEADTDGDGKITVDELYDYAFERIVNVTPKQTPGKWSYRQQGEIILRKSIRIEDIKPIPLPSELINAIESTLPLVREGAVQHLEELLNGKNIGLSHSARQALIKIATRDDSNRVATAARQALKAAGGVPQKTDAKKEINKGKVIKQRQQGQIGALLIFMVISLSLVLLYLILNPKLLQSFFSLPSTAATPTQVELGALPVDIADTSPGPLNDEAPTDTQIVSMTATPLTETSSLSIDTVPAITESPIVFISTPTIVSTSDPNCNNAPQRLRLRIDAQVVTKPIINNALRLRKTPEANAEIIEELPFGTIVTVTNGPRCEFFNSGYFWWWEVQSQQSRKTGWVVEGRDDIDDIFIRPKTGALFENDKDGVTLIYIPSGEFTMGISNEQVVKLESLCGTQKCKELLQESNPAHTTKITNGFWIYRTEVSNSSYAECLRVGICTANRDDGTNFTKSGYFDVYANHPVVWVEWAQAKTYCEWAGGRLPTSAEWEYAARGADRRLFPWGNDFPNGLQANVNIPFGDLKPIDDFENYASPFGALNMAGNVWEWVSDYYDSAYYKMTNTEWVDPKGPAAPDDKDDRVIRGGSVWFPSAYASVGVQDSEDPIFIEGNEYYGVGFRCIVEKP